MDYLTATSSELKRAARKKRTAWEEQRRHEKRMAEPNPACRMYGETDRPVDIAFNETCRKFEKETQW